jgi:hypothetical protein
MEQKDVMQNALMEAAVKHQDSVFNTHKTNSLIEKWSNYGYRTADGRSVNINFLDAGQGRRPFTSSQRANLAHMYENQASYMRQLGEDTISTQVGTFTKWALPMVRELYVNQILPEIATVQPVNSKYGVMLSAGHYYDDAKGTKFPQTTISNQPYQQNYGGMLSAGDESIKNLAKDYVTEYNPYHVTCTNGAGAANLNSTSPNCTPVSLQWGPIRAPGTLGQRTIFIRVYYRTAEAGGTTVYADCAADGTTLVDQYTQVVGSITRSTGAWTITPLTSAGAATTFPAATVIYWQFFSDFELVNTVTGAKIPSQSFQLTEHQIVAEQFCEMTQWSLQAQYTYEGQTTRQLEPELVNMMINEMATNIDRKGIQQMIDGALFAATYTYAGVFPGNMETIQNFLLMINALSARIQKATHRGPANFLVMSPTAWALLGMLGSHADFAQSVGTVMDPTHSEYNAHSGIYSAGILKGTNMRVYINPYQADTQVLVGYKGNGWLDAGYGYAPWVPVQMTDTLTTPSTLSSQKAVYSMGSLKMLRNWFYGVLTLSGLPTTTP